VIIINGVINVVVVMIGLRIRSPASELREVYRKSRVQVERHPSN
jgi:hypothetical protein